MSVKSTVAFKLTEPRIEEEYAVATVTVVSWNRFVVG